jgi:hypothetical protein
VSLGADTGALYKKLIWIYDLYPYQSKPKMHKFLIIGDSTKIKPMREYMDHGTPVMQFDIKHLDDIWDYYDCKKYYLVKDYSFCFKLIYAGKIGERHSEWGMDKVKREYWRMPSKFKKPPTFKSYYAKN